VNVSENVFQLDGKPPLLNCGEDEVKAFKSMIENYIFLSNAGL